MSIPDLSHLQLAVLHALGSKEISGRELRERLKKENIHRSGPGFYQIMSRLEDGDFVKGRYKDVNLDGQIVKERRYQLTGQGSKALTAAGNFYAPILKRLLDPRTNILAMIIILFNPLIYNV